MIRPFIATLVATIALLAASAAAGRASTELVVIDASKPGQKGAAHPLAMGGRSANGHEIQIQDNRYLVLDGKPWLPVMGEFHFSRYPEQYWEEELQKMKAGGVEIVATYLFWIHHEEIEGKFDWSGQRNLRRFVQLCANHGLYVFLRIGPWSHGEVRNGGFPDWLIASVPARRRNDPRYLLYVTRYFEQIGEQIKGLTWPEGGPIIGVQFENEYYERGPGAGAAHISELKSIARESGIVAPLYTVTGWGNPEFPAGEVIPVFGGYPDNFWESQLRDSPPSRYYFFESKRDNGEMGGPSPSGESAVSQYPYLMAEAGGGMQDAYHRRPVIGADDVAAIALTRLGSGANLYGYYMYQGGSNPAGKLTSLQESIESDHVYDLPVVSYDFQAPLGEFGQLRDSYRATKALHLFLQSFGSDLAPASSFLPNVTPKDAADKVTIRAAARLDGDRGFLFVNNYARNYPLSDHARVRFEIKLQAGTLLLPKDPVEIHAGGYFIWPVNLDVEGSTLQYATAQPLAKLRDRDPYYFFVAQKDIDPEFVFLDSSLASIDAIQATITHRNGTAMITGIRPGRNEAFSVRTRTGVTVHVLVLSASDGQNFWKFDNHVFLSPAKILFGSEELRLRSCEPKNLWLSVFPAFSTHPAASTPMRDEGRDGLFTTYVANVQPKKIELKWEQTREAAPSKPVQRGKYNAKAPTDRDFDAAAAWRITVAANALEGLSDGFLHIDYAGDVARLYSGQHLIADNFYNGQSWEVGLKRLAAIAIGHPIDLKIMPLRRDAPIYLPRASWPQFGSHGQIATVLRVTASPEYEIRLTLQKGN